MTYEPVMVAGEPELTVATRISGPEKDRLVQSLVDRLEALRVQNRQQQLRQLTRAAAWGSSIASLRRSKYDTGEYIENEHIHVTYWLAGGVDRHRPAPLR